jgi:hypothetical protein
MKYAKRLMWLVLLVSVAYSGRELLSVARLAKGLAANPGAAATSPALASQPAVAKGVAAEMDKLNLASKVADMDGSAADANVALQGPSANPAAPSLPPRPGHAEAGDTNSAPGRIFTAKGGSAKASRSGGAVIVDANGNRLELLPTERPKAEAAAAAATQAVKSLPKLELPSLDDPRADLQTRKLRAEGALLVCVLTTIVLAFWARKYRAD